MTWTGPQALAEQAEAAARSITDLGEQEWALSRLAAAMVGDLDRAQALARSISDPGRRARAAGGPGGGGGGGR